MSLGWTEISIKIFILRRIVKHKFQSTLGFVFAISVPLAMAKSGLAFLVHTEMTLTPFSHAAPSSRFPGCCSSYIICAMHFKIFYKVLANNTSNISAYRGVICQGFIVYFTRQRLKFVLHNPPF